MSKKRGGGTIGGFDPGNSYRNAKRFLRFPISVTLNPAQRARDYNPQTPAGNLVPCTLSFIYRFAINGC